jgi:integrase
MAAIEKRITDSGKTAYRVKVRLRGYAPESATFSSRADAKTWAAKTESEIRAGRHFGASKRHTFSELVTEYKPYARDLARLDHWKEVFGSDRLADITANRIAAERDKLLSVETKRKDKEGNLKTRSGGTVNRYLAALSSCLGFAVKELQWLERNPVERIKKPSEAKGRIRFLSDDELPKLLETCRKSKNKHLYLAVALSLTTGARQEEIMALRWPQIDLTRCLITLPKTKNGDARALPVVGEALKLLKERDKVRSISDNRLFPPTKRAKKAEYMDLRDPWETALKAANITDFHWHDLRHTAASAMAMSGVSLVEIAKILGHRTMQMVARYSHLSEGHILQTGEKLAAKLNLSGSK